MKNKIFARPVVRFIAFLTDFLIKLTVYFLIFGLVLKSGEIERVLDGFLIVIILYIYLSLILPVFFSYLTAKAGGSPGKIICGIAVTDEDGKYLSFRSSLFRYFVGYNLSAMFLGLGYLWILIDDKRRGWHDLASRSQVILIRPSGIFWGSAICALLISFNIFLYGFYANIFKQNKDNYQNAVNEILVESGIIDSSPTPTVYIKRIRAGDKL